MRSLQKIKELLTSAKVMAYFDPEKETELTTDVSPTGLSAILVQKSLDSDDRRVVSYISRTLTPVERHYTLRQRKRHLPLYGRMRSYTSISSEVTLSSVLIVSPFSWFLTTQTLSHKRESRDGTYTSKLYDFESIHTRGSHSPSDFLSCHAIPHEGRHRALGEVYICFLAENAVPKAMTLDEIYLVTKQNKTLKCLSWLIWSQQ